MRVLVIGSGPALGPRVRADLTTRAIQQAARLGSLKVDVRLAARIGDLAEVRVREVRSSGNPSSATKQSENPPSPS